MLEFDQVIHGDVEAPFIPKAVLDYLSTIYSASYQLRLGTPSKLVGSGLSEPYALGYLAGMEAAGEVLRLLVKRQEEGWNE